MIWKHTTLVLVGYVPVGRIFQFLDLLQQCSFLLLGQSGRRILRLELLLFGLHFFLLILQRLCTSALLRLDPSIRRGCPLGLDFSSAFDDLDRERFAEIAHGLDRRRCDTLAHGLVDYALDDGILECTTSIVVVSDALLVSQLTHEDVDLFIFTFLFAVVAFGLCKVRLIIFIFLRFIFVRAYT